MIRLGESETMIGKTFQIYEAKFLNGLRGFIILDSEQPIDLSKTQVTDAETQVNLKSYKFEQRINKLEKAIEDLTKAIEDIKASINSSSGFEAYSKAGVAESGKGARLRV